MFDKKSLESLADLIPESLKEDVKNYIDMAIESYNSELILIEKLIPEYEKLAKTMLTQADFWKQKYTLAPQAESPVYFKYWQSLSGESNRIQAEEQHFHQVKLTLTTSIQALRELYKIIDAESDLTKSNPPSDFDKN